MGFYDPLKIFKETILEHSFNQVNNRRGDTTSNGPIIPQKMQENNEAPFSKYRRNAVQSLCQYFQESDNTGRTQLVCSTNTMSKQIYSLNK